MAAVPFPLMSGLHGEKIGCSLVFHPLWEPQQDSVVQISHPGMIRRPGGNNKGKNVLKCCQYERRIPAPPPGISLFFIHSVALGFEGFTFESTAQ